jgi:hypothetical protein
VNTVYHKLSYIDTPLGIDNIRNLFSQNTPVLLSGGGNPNRNALDDMRAFIESNSQKHQKTSMRNLQDRFMKEPYGFVENDVEWLCAKLFKDGDINVYISNAQITVQDKTVNDLVNYFTKKQYADSLTTEIRQKANDTQLKTMREIMKALFNDSAPNDDEDALYQKFKQNGRELLGQLEKFAYKYQEYPEYPGESVIASGLEILQNILHISSSFSFFGELGQRKNDILDFADDYENVKIFFSGPQSGIFADAVEAAKSFDRNKNFITDNEIPDLIVAIDSIIGMENPYKEIYKLPNLTDKYNKALAEQCQKDREPLLSSLENKKKSIFAKLEGKPYKDDFNASLIIRLDAMERKIKECGDPSLLKVMNYEIDSVYTGVLNDIETKDAEIAATQAKRASSDALVPKPRHTNHVHIKSLINSPSWRIETANDIDNHLAELRHRIATKMKDDDILSVEF